MAIIMVKEYKPTKEKALGKIYNSTSFQAIADCVVAGATSEEIRAAVTKHCDEAIIFGLREKRESDAKN